MNLQKFLTALLAGVSVCAVAGENVQFSKNFPLDKSDLSSTGKSEYFVLEPGYVAVYEGTENGAKTVLTITVTSKTKVVDGVETRIVDEKETADGKVAEISHNYFAISKRTGDVYYFGEDTATYENGKIANHEGSWQAGVANAQCGLGLPGKPRVGTAYYQELAPEVAMDRAEVVSVTEALTTPAGEFRNCVKTEETSDLESGTEYKVYAPGVGLVQDGNLLLVKTTKAAATKPAKSANSNAGQGQGMGAAQNQSGSQGQSNQRQLQDPAAREALSFVGADGDATDYWMSAINDPSISPNERKDLIEDLNEDGLSDPHHPTADDMPLIASRIALIEDIGNDAMDDVNYDAFREAYKDLVNLLDGQPAQ